MDCSLPGSSVHGIFQARVLEWGAIAFSAVISSYPQNDQNAIPFNYLYYYLGTYPGGSVVTNLLADAGDAGDVG